MTDPKEGPDTEGLIERLRSTHDSYGRVAGYPLRTLFSDTADRLQALQARVSALEEELSEEYVRRARAEEQKLWEGRDLKAEVKDLEEQVKFRKEQSVWHHKRDAARSNYRLFADCEGGPLHGCLIEVLGGSDNIQISYSAEGSFGEKASSLAHYVFEERGTHGSREAWWFDEEPAFKHGPNTYDEMKATIAQLREALVEIENDCTGRVDPNGLPARIACQALAPEHPDTGTTPNTGEDDADT